MYIINNIATFYEFNLLLKLLFSTGMQDLTYDKVRVINMFYRNKFENIAQHYVLFHLGTLNRVTTKFQHISILVARYIPVNTNYKLSYTY